MVTSDETPTSHPEGHGHGGWAEPIDESDRGRRGSSHKSFDASNAPEPGPGAVESKEEREGVAPDDMTAQGALGVGESTSRRGEDVHTKGSGGSDRRTEQEGDPVAAATSSRADGRRPPRPTRARLNEPDRPDHQVSCGPAKRTSRRNSCLSGSR
ncbi:MAG: hypothetical protein JWO57_2690 [Pseudonocardiales bacterium]|nr:hypothetical protein [Pseudonocardiales bacterium]